MPGITGLLLNIIRTEIDSYYHIMYQKSHKSNLVSKYHQNRSNDFGPGESQWSYLCDKLGKVPLYISNWHVLINFLKASFIETPINHHKYKNEFFTWCENIVNCLDECYKLQKTPNMTKFFESRRYIITDKKIQQQQQQSFLDMKWASPYVQPEDQISFENAEFFDILSEVCIRLITILKNCNFETETENGWQNILTKIYDNFYNIRENGCSLKYQIKASRGDCVGVTTSTPIQSPKLVKSNGTKSYASIAASSPCGLDAGASPAGTPCELDAGSSPLRARPASGVNDESKLNIFRITTLEIHDGKITLEPGILGKDHYLELMSTPFSTDALRKENNDGVFITILMIENEVNIIEKLVYTSYSFVTELKSVQFEKKTGSYTIYMDESTYTLTKSTNNLKYEGEPFMFTKRRTKNFNETVEFVMIKSLFEWN